MSCVLLFFLFHSVNLSLSLYWETGICHFLVLQYDNGPFCKFVAKLLGVDTILFLLNTESYFPLSSLLVHNPHKSRHMYVVSDSSVGSMFVYSVGGWILISNEVCVCLILCFFLIPWMQPAVFLKGSHLFSIFRIEKPTVHMRMHGMPTGVHTHTHTDIKV
jgi:hypothetical protein